MKKVTDFLKLLVNATRVIAKDLRKIEAIDHAYKANTTNFEKAQQELQSVADNVVVLEDLLAGMHQKGQSWREIAAANPNPVLSYEVLQFHGTIAALKQQLFAFNFVDSPIASLVLKVLRERRMMNALTTPPQLVSDSSPESRIPQFPWPPPRASSTVVIPLQLIEANTSATTLRDVDSRIRQALEENGYFDSSYYAIPDGFALVTRIEQINDDGTPKAGIHRWSI